MKFKNIKIFNFVPMIIKVIYIPGAPFWWQIPLSIRSVGHSFSRSSILIFLATTSAWSLSFSATWCSQKESWVSTCVRPDLASIHNYGTPPFPPRPIIIIIIITRPKPAYGRRGLVGWLGQDTDQAGTFWGLLNVSLHASGAQLGFKPTWNH